VLTEEDFVGLASKVLAGDEPGGAALRG